MEPGSNAQLEEGPQEVLYEEVAPSCPGPGVSSDLPGKNIL